MNELRYIVNEKGEKKEVVIPIEDYEELLEDLHDLAVVAERKDEPVVPLEELLEKLKKNGILQDSS
ncbi:MAG: hypothetical protein ACP5HX_10410 [Thermoproteota archaeon]